MSFERCKCGRTFEKRHESDRVCSVCYITDPNTMLAECLDSSVEWSDREQGLLGSVETRLSVGADLTPKQLDWLKDCRDKSRRCRGD